MTPVTRGRRKKLFIALGLGALVVAGVAGYSTLNGASADVDPSKMATAEIGTMVKSVVATGKVEPITKVEIKSKANGIIKALPFDIDRSVKEGDVLAELDKDQLMAQLRGAEANLLAARAALEGAEASSKRTSSRPRGPMSISPARQPARAIAVRAAA